MKIGIFSNCYHPLVNGVVGAVDLLRKGFINSGHQVYLFAPQVDDYADSEEGIFRYPSVNLTRKVKYPVAIPFSARINRVMDQLDLDIIHTHHPFVLGPAARRIATRKGIPLVYTFHTQYDQYNHYIPLPGSVVSWAARRQVRRFCESVHRITTPAESAARILHDYGVERRVDVIPNPVDFDRFQKADGRKVRTRYQLGDEKVLINVGRVAPEKNLELLLSAFKDILIDGSVPGIKLIIVGDGPSLEGLKNQARGMEIESSVIFTGLVPPSDIPDFLASADLFVMTSFSEVKPLAQLEALAAGLPIVAVAAAGANDTVIHGVNGYLVAPEITAIRSQVVKLLRDEDNLKQLKSAALKTAGDYSYLRIAESFLNLYRQTIDEYN